MIYKNDKTCYMVTGLDFTNSANSLPVASKGISHAEYFAQKGIKLDFPDAKPMIAVEGRRKQTIYLPPELVAGNGTSVNQSFLWCVCLRIDFDK